MALIILDSNSVGAPALNAANGALCNVLDWALVQNGWTIEYTATNARVYRPGSGNRFRLHVRHDSAISGNTAYATVRGCEDATSATALVNPFPTVAQSSNTYSRWPGGSESYIGTPVYYEIIVGATFIIFRVDEDVSITGRGTYFFGDVAKMHASDNWNTVIGVRNADAAGTYYSAISAYPYQYSTLPSPATQPIKFYWCRSIDGYNKSTIGHLMGPYNSVSIGYGGAWPARNGYKNTLDRTNMMIGCTGVSSPGIPTSSLSPQRTVERRGAFPNLWIPLHNGPGELNETILFSDTVYNPAALFRFKYGGAGSSCWYILEETDTWVPPTY